MIPLPRWKPDVWDLNSPVANEASGVLPGVNSKRPWPSLAAFSQSLGAVCRGAWLCRTTAGAYAIFAGTETALFKFVGPGDAWTNVTRSAGGAYSVPSDERWSGDQFGNTLIVANINDAVQSIDVDSGTNFAALSGSPPNARVVRTIGDQVFLGSLASFPRRLHFGARNSTTGWTVGTQDSDIQDFPDGGYVTGLSRTLGSGGFVFQEGCVRKITPTNDRSIYTFTLIEDSQGCIAPDSIITHQATSYYYGTDGFIAIGPAGSKQIGLEAVDEWFEDNANLDRLNTICGALDPVRPRVFWLFPTTNTTGYVLDHVICYDILLDEWTHAALNASYLFSAATPGLTLEGLDATYPDLDLMDISLDAREFVGGAPQLAAFDSNNKLAFMSGGAMVATVETAQFQAIPGRRSFIRGVTPLTDSANVSVSISARENLNAVEMFGATSTLNSSGVAPTRSSGKYHRIRATIPADESWTHISGFEPDVVREGVR